MGNRAEGGPPPDNGDDFDFEPVRGKNNENGDERPSNSELNVETEKARFEVYNILKGIYLPYIRMRLKNNEEDIQKIDELIESQLSALNQNKELNDYQQGFLTIIEEVNQIVAKNELDIWGEKKEELTPKQQEMLDIIQRIMEQKLGISPLEKTSENYLRIQNELIQLIPDKEVDSLQELDDNDLVILLKRIHAIKSGEDDVKEEYSFTTVNEPNNTEEARKMIHHEIIGRNLNKLEQVITSLGDSLYQFMKRLQFNFEKTTTTIESGDQDVKYLQDRINTIVIPKILSKIDDLFQNCIKINFRDSKGIGSGVDTFMIDFEKEMKEYIDVSRFVKNEENGIEIRDTVNELFGQEYYDTELGEFAKDLGLTCGVVDSFNSQNMPTKVQSDASRRLLFGEDKSELYKHKEAIHKAFMEIVQSMKKLLG